MNPFATHELLRLVLLVVTGAGWLTVHVACLLAGLTARRHLGWRLLALLPPATPLVAFAAGRRATPIAWLAFAASYVVLRFVAPV